jgi:hypothetical protein
MKDGFKHMIQPGIRIPRPQTDNTQKGNPGRPYGISDKHEDCGRAYPSGEPLDSDCLCRDTPDQAMCAAAGCGFCRAAESNEAKKNLVYRLRKRAEIRRSITTRKSVQLSEPDRIADLLEEAATEIENLRSQMVR